MQAVPTVVPNQLTMRLARQMIAEAARTSGAEAVRTMLADCPPGQLAALVGVLLSTAAAGRKPHKGKPTSTLRIACRYCGAKADELCTTRAGLPVARPHAARITGRLCPCGTELVGDRQHATYCASCAIARARASRRDYMRRTRAERRAAA